MNRQPFVVLRHELGGSLLRTDNIAEPIHLDWMFRCDDALWTWATPVINRFDRPATFVGQRLGDHRLAYLDYEGEVSGNRGVVRRILRGTYRTIESSAGRFKIEMRGSENHDHITAILVCHRIRTDSDCEPAVPPDAWSMSLSPGRYETN